MVLPCSPPCQPAPHWRRPTARSTPHRSTTLESASGAPRTGRRRSTGRSLLSFDVSVPLHRLGESWRREWRQRKRGRRRERKREWQAQPWDGSYQSRGVVDWAYSEDRPLLCCLKKSRIAMAKQRSSLCGEMGAPRVALYGAAPGSQWRPLTGVVAARVTRGEGALAFLEV